MAAAAALFVLQPWLVASPRGGLEPARQIRAADVARTPARSRGEASQQAPAPPPTAGVAEPGKPAEAVQRIPAGSSADDPGLKQRELSRDVLTTWTVRPGDTLSGLAVQVYGFTSDRLLAAIQRFNPDIADVHSISPGTRIRFPRAPNI
jgi:nucleoid-associated protein YgaU